MKKEKIAKEIINWVKDGEGVLHLSEGKYEYVFGKMNVVKNLTTVFLFGSSYTKSVFTELEKGSMEIVGHYIPVKNVFVDFSFYSPVWDGIESIIPANNLFSNKVKEDMSSIFLDSLKKEIEENKYSRSFKRVLSSKEINTEEETFARIHVNGLYNVIRDETEWFLSTIQGRISFEDVIKFLIGEEVFAEKKNDFDDVKSSLQEQMATVMLYNERMEKYVPRETDEAYIRIRRAISSFCAEKGKTPKKVKVAIENQDSKISFNGEIEMENFKWYFEGFPLWQIKNPSSSQENSIDYLFKKGLEWKMKLSESNIPYSSIKEIRYGRNIIYSK